MKGIIQQSKTLGLSNKTNLQYSKLTQRPIQTCMQNCFVRIFFANFYQFCIIRVIFCVKIMAKQILHFFLIT